jgi:hypothetical protein
MSKQIILKHSKWLYKNEEFDSDCESVFKKLQKYSQKRLGLKHLHNAHLFFHHFPVGNFL